MATVLVVEQEPGASIEATLALVEAGHDVVRCQSPAGPALPCAGLRPDGVCPFDTSDVEVAVDVRTSGAVTTREIGAVCALRQGVPLLVLSDEIGQRFDRSARRSSRETLLDDVDLAVTSSPLRQAAQAARTAARAVARRAGLDAARVDVHLRDEGHYVGVYVELHQIPAGPVAAEIGDAVSWAVTSVMPDALQDQVHFVLARPRSHPGSVVSWPSAGRR